MSQSMINNKIVSDSNQLIDDNVESNFFLVITFIKNKLIAAFKT